MSDFTWEELSAKALGLVYIGRHDPFMYHPDNFFGVYGEALRILQKPGATKEDVAQAISQEYLEHAFHSATRLNGMGDTENFDYAKALINAKRNYEIGQMWYKGSKKLINNEYYDFLPMYTQLGSFIAGQSSGLRDARDYDYSTYKPFIKSGNPVYDKVLGGIPADGPIVKCGPTGVGKSHSLASDVDYFLAQYPNKTAAIYTLEMSAEHYLWRETNMYPSLIKHIQEGRLKVSGSVSTMEELVSEVMTSRVDYVGLDDIDRMVKNKEAAGYEAVYARVIEVCRFMKIPFEVLCQPNREAKKSLERGERFIGLYDAAWSGAAENASALFIGLQHVKSEVDMESSTFPTGDDLYYEIFWKSRDGWPSDYDPNGQQGPGAIIRSKGKQAWRGEPYAGKYKLWQPGSGNKTIGKSKKSGE